jgi:hypothetical protein
VILNLVVAVILEGFEDSSKNEVSELVDRCIYIWKKYDTNCDMKLSLKDTLSFVQEAATDFGCPDLQFSRMLIPNSDRLDLSKFPIRGSSMCKVMVSADTQEVHFIHALKWALRVVLSNNDPGKLKDIDEAEDTDGGEIWRLEEQQARRQGVHEKMSECVFLQVLVATAKIQQHFRVIKGKNGPPSAPETEARVGGDMQPRAAG